MNTFPLRLPEALRSTLAQQAEEAGVSLNQFITMTLVGRVAAQEEAERYFQARAKRATPGRAAAILARAGTQNPPREDDDLDGEAGTET